MGFILRHRYYNKDIIYIYRNDLILYFISHCTMKIYQIVNYYKAIMKCNRYLIYVDFRHCIFDTDTICVKIIFKKFADTFLYLLIAGKCNCDILNFIIIKLFLGTHTHIIPEIRTLVDLKVS